MSTKLTYCQIESAVHEAYESCKSIKGGQNAHYIPYLANVGNGEVYLYPSRRTFRKEIYEIANEGIGMRNVMERMR